MVDEEWLSGLRGVGRKGCPPEVVEWKEALNLSDPYICAP